MSKEKVLSIILQDTPKYIDRVVRMEDYNKVVEDKEGERITLASDKRKYPYQLLHSLPVTINTTEGRYQFVIPPEYVWNGADIPRFVWMFVGSKDDPKFKIPSLIHDFMLEYKWELMNEFGMDSKEYLRLSTLTFRQALKMNGTRVVKSNVMSWFVQVFQSTVNRKAWRTKNG